MRIYIQGAWKQSQVPMLVRRAVQVADVVLATGHVPFVPQLWHLWQLLSPKQAHVWDELELKWLAACDALLFLNPTVYGRPGQALYDFAQRQGLRIFRGKGDFLRAVKKGWPKNLVEAT